MAVIKVIEIQDLSDQPWQGLLPSLVSAAYTMLKVINAAVHTITEPYSPHGDAH